MNNLQSSDHYDRLSARGVTFDKDRATVEQVLNSIDIHDVAAMFDAALDSKFKR